MHIFNSNIPQYKAYNTQVSVSVKTDMMKKTKHFCIFLVLKFTQFKARESLKVEYQFLNECVCNMNERRSARK